MTLKPGRRFSWAQRRATASGLLWYGSNSSALPAWNTSQTTPQGAELGYPILAWQYAGNLGPDQSLDCNISNLSGEGGLMEKLILPP